MLTSDLWEGVSYDREQKQFKFDWEHDKDDDIIKLSTSKIKKHNTFYYEFATVAKARKEDKDEFLEYIKTDEGLKDKNVQYMLKKCIDEF